MNTKQSTENLSNNHKVCWKNSDRWYQQL